MFGRMKDSVKNKIKGKAMETDAYKNFEQSEDYDKMKKF
jgi:hypothetical protein